MPQIRLTGQIEVPADRLDEVSRALPDHIRLTGAEPGCLLFEVTADDAMPGRFLVNELFRDRAAFDAHQARGAASDWGRITQGIPRSYQIDEIDV